MDTPAEKLRNFFQIIPRIHDETIHMAYLDTQWYGYAVKYLNHIYTASLVCSLMINFFIFSTSIRKVEENFTYPEYENFFFFN